MKQRKRHLFIFNFNIMKQFAKNIVLFIVFTCIAYPILISISGYLLPQKLSPNINYRIGSYGHMYTRLNEAKNFKGELDVLFLGSSHSYRGFDTRNFNDLKTFNLGSSAQTPIQTNVLLDRYLDKLNPKMIVYEVYPNTFTSDGVESSLDIIANDKNDLNSLEMAFEINHIKVYNTLIYGFFRDAFELNKSFSEPIKKGEDTYIPGGFVQRKITYFKHIDYPEKDEWKLNEEQIKVFESIVKRIKDKKIKLMLVYAPITSSYYKSHTNNAYFDKFIISHHAEYYNFNTMLTLNDSLHFYDSNHLNQNGVREFNKKLLELIDLNKK